MNRRSFLIGSAFTVTGCLDRPWYGENHRQEAFLDQLQVLAKPALASNNPLKLEDAVKQSLALAAQTGAFTEWQGILRTIEGNAQKMAVSIDIGPQVSLYAFNDWTLAMPGALAELFSTRSRESAPPGLSEQAVAALKTFPLGARIVLSGRMGEIAASGLFDLSTLFGKSDADNRQ